LDISHLTAGNYLLRIVTENQVVVQQFIKQ